MVESPPDHDVDKPYFLLGVNIYALVSVALSLATNALATSLIAYKSWCVLLVFILGHYNIQCQPRGL